MIIDATNSNKQTKNHTPSVVIVYNFLKIFFNSYIQIMIKWKGPIFARGLWQKERRAKWAVKLMGMGEGLSSHPGDRYNYD